MHVSATNISKANVCPYYGKEIPGWEELGLEPNKIYRLYRDPKELELGAASFNNIQLLHKHIKVSADEPQKESVCGCLSNVFYEHPYLKADLCVWTAEAIAMIEAEALEELSSAYHYKAVMTPGTSSDGENFDGVMTAILGNHLALVETGRAGSDVIVADAAIDRPSGKDLPGNDVGSGKGKSITADSNPFKKEIPAMKTTKLGNALIVALSAASPKIAQDSALPNLVGGAKKRGFNKKDVVAKICAMDEDIAPEKVDEIVDALLGVEENPEPYEPKKIGEDNEEDGGASSKHAEIIDFLKSKGLDASDLEAVGNMLTRMDRPFGKDENLMKPEEVDAKVNTAMDSLSKELKAQFKALEEAKAAVRPVVGDVIGMDSAADVFRFALSEMKVDHKGMPDAGLPQLFAVANSRPAAPAQKVAMDSASVAKAIPALSRIRTV